MTRVFGTTSPDAKKCDRAKVKFDQFHFQPANCSRRAVFLNLPTLVRGIASTKTKASGSCQLANDFARNSRNSCSVALAPSRRTTAARGRSWRRWFCAKDMWLFQFLEDAHVPLGERKYEAA